MADANVSQMVNYSLKMVEIALTSVGTMSDVLYKALQMFEGNKHVRAMSQLIKNGEVEYVNCDVDEMETLRRRLEAKGVGVNPETGMKQEGVIPMIARGKDGNTQGMLVYNVKYHDLVVKEMIEFHAEQKGGVVTPRFLKQYGEGLYKEINNIDKDELILFDKECKNYNIPYCIEGPENDKYTIRFAARDTDEMERVRMNASIILAGKTKNLYRKQLMYENNNRLRIRNTVLNGTDINGKVIEKGTTIISRDGKRINFLPNAIESITETGMHIYKRNSPNFRDEINAIVSNMDRPVLMSQEQYREYCNSENKDDFLTDIEREQGKVKLSQEEIEELAKEMKQREQIEQKLSSEHAQTLRVDYSDYNLEQSLFSFKEAEKQNYEAVHDKAEVGQVDANFYDDAESNYVGWIITDSEKTPDEMILEEEVLESNLDLEEDFMIDDIAHSPYHDENIDDVHLD